MGCDIHAYVEFYSKKDLSLYQSYSASAFAGDIMFNRDYVLFGVLAGVRCMVDPAFPVRGLPTAPEVSFDIQAEYFLRVVDEAEVQHHMDYFGRQVVTKEKAEQMVKKYGVQYANTEKTLLANPDWHTPTWLTLPELMEVRKKYLLEQIQFYSDIRSKKKIQQMVDFIENTSAEKLMSFSFTEHDSLVLNATIASMAALERTCKDNDIVSRFVCWFDS